MPSARTGTGIGRIGAYLSIPTSTIEWAISVQNEELSVGNLKPIGEILVEREQITHEDLLNALALQRLDRLRQCALFADLSNPDLARISQKSEEVALVQGQELLRQDARGDSIYAVLSGRLLIYRREGHQDGVPVGVAVAGDFLGDTDYFSFGTRSNTACAIEPALLLRTRYELLRECASFSHGKVLGGEQVFFPLPCSQSPLGSIEESRDAAAAGIFHAKADDLMERIVQRAARVMEADRAHLFLLEAEAGTLHATVASGKQRRTFRVQAGAEIVGFVAQTGELVVLSEAYLDDRFNPAIDVWTGYWTRTLMAGPVRDARGAIVGVIQVVNKNKGFFTREDEVLFRAYARQASCAVVTCLSKERRSSHE